MELGLAFAIMGGALAVGLAGGGSAMGISYAGQMSCGILTESPEKFGSLMILSIMPGTQGIYGLATCFIVAMRIGLMTGTPLPLTTAQGLQIFGACLPMALAGFISAPYQGKVAASGAAAVARRAEEFGHAMIMVALVEIYALFGFIITLMFVWIFIPL